MTLWKEASDVFRDFLGIPLPGAKRDLKEAVTHTVAPY